MAVITTGTTTTGIRHGVTVLRPSIMPMMDRSMWVNVLSPGPSDRGRAELQQMGCRVRWMDCSGR